MAKAIAQIRSLARAHTESAVNVLAGIMNEPEAPHAARVSAAQALLDRGWGKPTQPIGGDDDADAIRIETIRRLIVDAPKQLGYSDSARIPATPEPEPV